MTEAKQQSRCREMFEAWVESSPVIEYPYTIDHQEAKHAWNAWQAAYAAGRDDAEAWVEVDDFLPSHNDDVLMAYDDSDAVVLGKYFDGGSTLTGFAAKSVTGSHFVGKPFVTRWRLCPKPIKHQRQENHP